MRRLLQYQSHDDVPYDRPNLPWVCGKAAEGCPCKAGPTAGGRCPEKRCRPQRSLRVRRGRLAVGAALFVAGLLALLIGSPARNELLAPGALTQSHAQLLSGDRAAGRCAACHPGGPEAVLGIGASDPNHASQSTLCVECHKSLIAPELALAPHGVPGESLRRGGETGQPRVHKAGFGGMSDGFLSSGSGHAKSEVACATCHQEHHGADHDLSAITDRRCQACHQEQFTSFAKDHPDFGLWPYRRRTRINFDHNSHATKHYADKNEAFDCAACHLDGPRGDAKLLASYEAACARCHDGGINTSLGDGLAVVSLPMLDREAIADAGGDLGPWPAAATGDFDGDLSAIAKLLLAADPEARQVLDRLGARFTFFDLDPGAEQDARDALVLAESLRRLMQGLAGRGHEEVLERAGRLSARQDRDLVAAMPVTAVDRVRESWFGPGAEALDGPAAIELAGRQGAGGWFVDDRGLSLRYLPQGHADPLLRSWIELAASLGDEHTGLRDAALDELAGATSVGRCATCHSIDQTPEGLVVNWRGLNAAARPRSFTRFSHRPHVLQPQLADCTYCHQLDQDASRVASPYATMRPSEFVAQFQPITKNACTSCHQPKAAGASCTQCHNYHVEPVGERLKASDEW